MDMLRCCANPRDPTDGNVIEPETNTPCEEKRKRKRQRANIKIDRLFQVPDNVVDLVGVVVLLLLLLYK